MTAHRDVPLYQVIAERKRLEAALLEGRAHAHLIWRHPTTRGGMQWVFVTRGRNSLCGTKRCLDFGHVLHLATVGEKLGTRASA